MDNEKLLWIAKVLLLVFAKVDVVTVVVEIAVTIVCFCSVGKENGNGVCVTCVLLWAFTTWLLVFTTYLWMTLFFLLCEAV